MVVPADPSEETAARIHQLTPLLQRIAATIGLFDVITDLAESRAPFIRNIHGDHCQYTPRTSILEKSR